MQFYSYSDINRGIPKRECAKSMADFIERIADQMQIHFMFLAIVSIFNSLSVWILHSRYILMITDDDLYGDDSEYDEDEKSCISYNPSTFETSKREEIPIVKATQLNLDINKTLMQRKERARFHHANTDMRLPLPRIAEKKESDNLDVLIGTLKSKQ